MRGIWVIKGLLLAAFGASSMSVVAQTYPTKPVRILVGFAPGGGTDIMARVIAAKLGESMKHQFIVENRPGANANLAAKLAAEAPGDGYTLLFMSVAHIMSKPVYKNLGYDIERDLTPITVVSSVPNVLCVNPALPAQTVKELIALAKSKPGELTYAANFRGSLPNMTGEMFASHAGIKLTFIPYPGAPPALQDVLGGRVSLMVEGIAAFTGVLQSNSVKALAVTTPNRLANFPDLPAAAETLPGYQSRGWTAVIAPAGTTDDVVRKVNADLRTVLDIPEVKSRLESSATYVRHMSPAETRDYIRAEQQAWRPVVKQFGVTTP